MLNLVQTSLHLAVYIMMKNQSCSFLKLFFTSLAGQEEDQCLRSSNQLYNNEYFHKIILTKSNS